MTYIVSKNGKFLNPPNQSSANVIYERSFIEAKLLNFFYFQYVLVCAPSGEIMVVSVCDGGKATDCELVNQSGFLRFLKPGDKVLADKG